MGRGSGIEIFSPPKISPREEKAWFQEQSAHRRQGFSSHGLILRWNFHTWNAWLIWKMYSCKSQPSNQRFRNLEMAITYLYRLIHEYDFLWFCDFESSFFFLSSAWAELHKKFQIQSRRTDLIFAMIAKRHNTYCVIISMNVHNNAKVTLEFDRLNFTYLTFQALC